MKKTTLLVTLLLLLISFRTEADTADFSTLGFKNTRQWQHNNTSSIKQRVQHKAPNAPTTTASDQQLDKTEAWGTLNATDGTIWTYTMSYEYIKDDTGNNTNYYSAVSIRIYNNENKLMGEINDVFDNENERINYVAINPLITKSFFNLSGSNYEVIIYIHSITGAPDYQTRSFNDIYSIGNPEKLCTIEGNQVLSENLATDAWSENYTLIFERESSTDDNYYLHYDVYTKATYSSPTHPVLAHTFDMDYSYIAGSGNESAPILMVQYQNKLYYALAQYEKPYFIYSDNWLEEPQVSPDNNFVITLYDNTFTEQSVTKIPVPEAGGEYIWSFPAMGGLRYNEDLAFGMFTEGEEPAYIVSIEQYVSLDDFVTSFYVYNTKGERIATIAEKASAAIIMSDVAGQPEQWCFYEEGEEESWFCFVDLPSCKEVAKLPTSYDNIPLTMSLDRYIAGDSYQYAVSMAKSSTDSEKNIIHSIAWFNADGSFDHYDELNLGQDIAIALPYMNADAFNPWLFNTDDAREYMFLVKRYQKAGSTATDEVLYVVNTKGERLLEYGPDPKKGGTLLSIMLYNLDTKPTLLCVYCDIASWQYTLNMTWLPLSKFAAGGNGTADNPYIITSPGDFQQIDSDPSAYYTIANDLNFQNIPWSGLKKTFSGNLNGENHVVTNLALEHNGLFTNISNAATIKNLQLYKPILTLQSDSHTAGLIANNMTGGMNSNEEGTPGILNNIHIYSPLVSAPDTYDEDFGGIAGTIALYTQISQCSVVDAQFDLPDASVGGIVGSLKTSSTITACAFSGTIVGNTAGGIAANSVKGDEKISNCHSTAQITGGTIGGIIGNSARSSISNCHAEGTLTIPTEISEGKAGGIAGELAENNGETNNVIEECLVGISSIDYPNENKTYVHRIVGYTGIDKISYDWDYMDEHPDEYDYNDRSTWPTLPGVTETAIANNYVISALDIIDTNIEATSNTTEGATLTTEALTTDFLSEHNFNAGNSIDAPWVHTTNPYLWFEKESGVLIVDKKDITLSIGDAITVCFTILNGDANSIETNLSASCAEILSTDVAGDQLYVTLTAITEGDATLTATYEEKTAVCTIHCINETAVDNIYEQNLILSYNGTVLEAENAHISLYSISGTLVKQGKNCIYTEGLTQGIYIARAHNTNGSETLKIAIR
ncbi:MAG: T9SS type A sorting domain-containing protein [Paludibacter sp.]|nr:T9SS type A sorting domain-containing protein [Bacteroidales bacterium]MCM1069335.1 T9SS type A sorting domain-containing protein [Prevotella sp.]MCM1353855.1 T9SS type A sorting domain-containing protein [Bacteroides sp.]MCM1442895.1 T9SS type A sorting domain-containing protein [Muribaculum sp.]MCM1481940.1 T9SS type A sorting domain-containing protein [Paludibacter sp.]